MLGYNAMPNEADHGGYENEVGDCTYLHAGAPNRDWRQTLKHVVVSFNTVWQKPGIAAR